MSAGLQTQLLKCPGVWGTPDRATRTLAAPFTGIPGVATCTYASSTLPSHSDRSNSSIPLVIVVDALPVSLRTGC
jgi:hypothetical protein